MANGAISGLVCFALQLEQQACCCAPSRTQDLPGLGYMREERVVARRPHAAEAGQRRRSYTNLVSPLAHSY
jgi:hypothetical protein